MYLLDTNICIAILKDEHAAWRGLRALPSSRIGIPAIVLAELSHGAWKSEYAARSLAKLADFMEIYNVIPFDEQAARQYGRVRALLQRDGLLIGTKDNMIAATALSLDATLVTRNVREFSRVPELRWITF